MRTQKTKAQSDTGYISMSSKLVWGLTQTLLTSVLSVIILLPNMLFGQTGSNNAPNPSYSDLTQ